MKKLVILLCLDLLLPRSIPKPITRGLYTISNSLSIIYLQIFDKKGDMTFVISPLTVMTCRLRLG